MINSAFEWLPEKYIFKKRSDRDRGLRMWERLRYVKLFSSNLTLLVRLQALEEQGGEGIPWALYMTAKTDSRGGI